MRPLKVPNTTRLKDRTLAVYCVVVFCLVLGSQIASAEEYDIALSLNYPAGDKTAPQPTGLYVDSYTGDIFVTDASTSRIVIFDSQRRYSFEFSTRDRLSSPTQVAVDSLGRIFVFGDTREHTLAVFDYNGDFLRYLDLDANGSRLTPSGFAIGVSDELYALVLEPARVYVYSSSGELKRDFAVLEEADDETRNTSMVGNFVVTNNEMLFSLPMIGQAARIDLNGKLIRIFGVHGGGKTELSFPAAVAKTIDGEYVVLDKHRHLLQYFNSDGQYQREVGGAGMVEGWFFHPTSLACCFDGTLLVGQMYQNRIQSVVFRNAPVVTGS